MKRLGARCSILSAFFHARRIKLPWALPPFGCVRGSFLSTLNQNAQTTTTIRQWKFPHSAEWWHKHRAVTCNTIMLLPLPSALLLFVKCTHFSPFPVSLLHTTHPDGSKKTFPKSFQQTSTKLAYKNASGRGFGRSTKLGTLPRRWKLLLTITSQLPFVLHAAARHEMCSGEFD